MPEVPDGPEVPNRVGLLPAARLPRLFFALWPPDDLREQLMRDTQERVRDSGGRIIPARNFHVTVLFVGEVLQPRVKAVIAAGAATSSPAFTLTLDHIDAWPGSNVLVLTGADAPTALGTLVEGLRFNLLNNQIKLQRAIYRPHITLARKLPRIRPLEKIEPVEWRVKEFVLVDSTVTRGGSQYQVLGRWPLA